jgi:hypothetical protein
MALRGYTEVEPLLVERITDEGYLWLFDYRLPEGDLTLEVSWTAETGWSATVWDFQTRPRR